MAGVQTLLPLMLDHMQAGRLSLARLVDLTSGGPARILACPTRVASPLARTPTWSSWISPGAKSSRTLASRAAVGWTPFDGQEVTGWPVATVLRCRVVMREGEVIGEPGGQPLRFLGMKAASPEFASS